MDNLNKNQQKKHNPASLGLRKPLILGVVVFCLVISIWAVIESLSSDPNNNNQKITIAASNGKEINPVESINQLPGNYGSAKFKKFLRSAEPVQSISNSAIDNLREELSSLKNNYESLQNQLIEQQNLPTTPPKSATGSETETEQQRAIQSPIFVPVSSGYADFNNNNKKSNDTNGNKDNDDSNDNDSESVNKVHYPKSSNILLSGSSIPAVLQTEVVSDVPGTVVGIVRQNVYDSIHGTHVLIPKGARLIGSYYSSIMYGQNSLQVAFRRLIRPDGSSIDLGRFPGTSPTGTSGMAEDVNNHWGTIIGAAFLSSVFSIPSILASSSQFTSSSCITGRDSNNNPIYGACGNGTQTKGALYQSFGQTASRIGSRLTSRALSMRPTVYIHPGYTFSVLVVKDLVLPPYKEKD